MEQDLIVGLYESAGMSVGAEFSSEDMSHLYRKVFHVPSNAGEAHTAMKKIAGCDGGWSCAGENVFEVLLEMERERERKEQLYWDLQLLNVRNCAGVMDKPVILDPDVLNCLQQSTNPDTFTKAYNESGSESLHSCTIQADCLQMGRPRGKIKVYGNVRRLKKAARQCWARLASEGVQSIVVTPWQGKKLEVSGKAWGCLSLSDVLLLLEVKYDVVTNLLYTEMLQEHYTPSIWETRLPWQQHKDREELEDLAEEVLVSGDMLHLAELPGAFRMYRTCLGSSFRSCPVSREQTWSAVSLLYELHTTRQQERATLTVLGERLDRESMRLLCLHIKLATLRAQREKMSYSALLAAKQSWETWPHMNSPCRAEQAALWVQGDEEEQSEHLISVSPQQDSVLKLLVLTQEQERKHLVQLVHEVSLEDLQGAGCTVLPNEESTKQAVLRNGCIERLRQIRASLQTPSETQTHLEKANLRIQLQAEDQLQIQANMCSKSEMLSQHQLENYALLLLTCLLELQDVQASTTLTKLVDMSAQDLKLLQADYESELQAQRYTNLLPLLTPDEPLTSGLTRTPCPNLTENSSSSEQMTTQSCCNGPAEPQNSSDGAAEALKGDSVRVQTDEGTNKQDVCTGCGAVMEELPYLEILCFSDATCNIHQNLSEERGAQEEEEGSTTNSPQSYEKQGSLITLAWSKPPDDDTDYEVGSADGGRGGSLDSESSVKTQAQSSDISSTTENTQCDETSGESYDEESGCAGHRDTQCADQQCSTGQLILERRLMADQPQKEEAMSECHLQTHTLATAAQPHLLVDLPEIKSHTDDLCSGLSTKTADTSRDIVEVETCQTATESDQHELRMPDHTDEDLKDTSQIKADCDLTEREAVRVSMLMEREQVKEPVSAMERERTMRNLVDMQRKVEQRQQRDRERQLLRIQERLSIIQSRKAEEDLLGLKHTDRLKHLTQDLPQEDKNQQKTVVRERLEQLRRERSYVMQSKRDRNTAGFKELLDPVSLHSREAENETDL